jgi:predicted DCC family thiol-disulfide oxidoreductase YuxK
MAAENSVKPEPADLTRPTNAGPAGVTAPVILFDSTCNLCSASVRWVIRQDRHGVFRFASLQSRVGQEATRFAGVDPAGLPDSLVLIDDAGLHTRSEAALRIAGRLGFPWSLARVARILPPGWRDGAYAVVARNRYRWLGRRESCLRPMPERPARFLDADEPGPPGCSTDSTSSG